MHYLYRLYTAGRNDLLYVGISRNFANRLTQHRNDKKWWPEVGAVDVECFPSEREAAIAERAAIQSESPRYNVAHAKPLPRGRMSPGIQWICYECDRPIADGEGYVHIDYAMLDLAKRKWAELLELDPQLASQTFQAVHWFTHHSKCDPNPDHLCWWKDVGALRTSEQLLSTTVHLSGKRWFDLSDWPGLLRETVNR